MSRDIIPNELEPGRWARLGSAGLLLVAGLLAVGLALLGIRSQRRMDAVAGRALEGRALEMGLGSAAAIMALRPRGPERLRRAVKLLADDHIRVADVVNRKGRIMASTAEGRRGKRLGSKRALRRLRQGKVLYHVSELSAGDRPVYEVWIALRPGRRGRHWRRWRPFGRGRWRGTGPGPRQGMGPGATANHHRGPGPGAWKGPWKGRPPWGRAYLRLEVEVTDVAISMARRDARWTRLVTLSAAAVLLLLSVLLFLADRRARRLGRVSARQRSLAEMGEMAAVLAHEIRTPLGVIKGHAQLLAGKSEPEAAQKLELLVEQSGRLERLVNGLLDYARPGPPRLQAVAADALVDKACELVAADALEREVALIRDLEPGEMRADADQLLQLVLNLLRNALQASPAGVGATVTVRLRHRSGAVVLEVVDAGPGLPAEPGQDIFKPFVTTRAGGTGLGLAVSRRIAEAHGGNLRGESGPERGARFVLTLPAAGPPKGATA